MAPQWITTIGLITDIVGACLFARGLFVTKAQALDLGASYNMDGPIERQLKVPPVADRLRQSRYASVGLPLLVLGFILQIIGTWMR